jgi:hypothetical protein
MNVSMNYIDNSHKMSTKRYYLNLKKKVGSILSLLDAQFSAVIQNYVSVTK